ncbi:hypothetical protein KY348_00820 [Candidatus Woesearchaeota archaeon]|nr:hypothetical protein [Candidatus Woesearchaeota archaeon]
MNNLKVIYNGDLHYATELLSEVKHGQESLDKFIYYALNHSQLHKVYFVGEAPVPDSFLKRDYSDDSPYLFIFNERGSPENNLFFTGFKFGDFTKSKMARLGEKIQKPRMKDDGFQVEKTIRFNQKEMYGRKICPGIKMNLQHPGTLLFDPMPDFNLDTLVVSNDGSMRGNYSVEVIESKEPFEGIQYKIDVGKNGVEAPDIRGVGIGRDTGVFAFIEKMGSYIPSANTRFVDVSMPEGKHFYKRLHTGHYIDHKGNVLINDETLYDQAAKILGLDSVKDANFLNPKKTHLADFLVDYITQLEENA